MSWPSPTSIAMPFSSSICEPLQADLDEEDLASMEKLQLLLNYRFRDPNLLLHALTHPSHRRTQAFSYQRLEFLGDAALTLALSNYIFLTNPSTPPGLLSAIRAANISTEKLARVAVDNDLYPLLRRNDPTLDLAVSAFTRSVLSSPSAPAGHTAFGGPDMRAPKVLADLVESIAGAVYVDCGLDLERMWVVVRGLLEPIVTVEDLDDQPVAKLHELCQKLRKPLAFHDSVHGNLNVSHAIVDGKLLGVGLSERKKIAKMNAAREALPKLSAEVDRELNTGGMVVESGEKEGKRKLRELCAKNHWPNPSYSVELQNTVPNQKGYICCVRLTIRQGDYHARGKLKSKVKEAENDAACELLKMILAQHQEAIESTAVESEISWVS